MSAKILKGIPVSKNIKLSLNKRIHKLLDKNVVPTLAAVLVGNHSASEIYVNSKHKTFIKNNCNGIVHKLDKSISQDELTSFINSLNSDNSIHGILIQLPLPKHLNEGTILNTIHPNKDVDGFHPINIGKLL